MRAGKGPASQNVVAALAVAGHKVVLATKTIASLECLDAVQKFSVCVRYGQLDKAVLVSSTKPKNLTPPDVVVKAPGLPCAVRWYVPGQRFETIRNNTALKR